MMKNLIKQPNGKYCISNYDKGIEKYNLTEQDVINMYIEEAKVHISVAEHYSNIIKRTVGYGYDEPLNKISDDVLNEMGFDKTYDELIKFVPRKPKNQDYVGHDCTTYGKCPNCGKTVQNGMGGKDEKCRSCGQMLNWKEY